MIFRKVKHRGSIGHCRFLPPPLPKVAPRPDDAASRAPSCADSFALWQRAHYDIRMNTLELRREIKRAIDRLPPERLESLADYVHFLSRPSLDQRLEEA